MNSFSLDRQTSLDQYASRDSDPSSMDCYLREIARYPLLSAVQEQAVARRVRQGDAEARDMLINSNLRLVVSVAKRYHYAYFPMSDCVQEGAIGLIKAVEKYDPDKLNPQTGRPYKFSTYATWWIRQAISRAVIDRGPTINLPVHVENNIAKMKRICSKYANAQGREISLAELATAMKMRIEQVLELQSYDFSLLSLDEPMEEFNGDVSLGDALADPESPYTAVEERDEEARIHALLAMPMLNEREHEIVALRAGLDGTAHSLEEVGELFHITRERVRQIQKKATEKLAEPARRMVAEEEIAV